MAIIYDMLELDGLPGVGDVVGVPGIGADVELEGEDPTPAGAADGHLVAVTASLGLCGEVLGAGRPEATATSERAVDLLAVECGLYRVEVRRANLIPAVRKTHHTAAGAT